MDKYISLELAKAAVRRESWDHDGDRISTERVEEILDGLPPAEVVAVTWIKNQAEMPESAGYYATALRKLLSRQGVR